MRYAVLTTLVLAAAASAQVRLPILQGDAVFSGTTVGGSLGAPTINSLGNVGCAGTLAGSIQTLFTDVGGLRVIARIGDGAPGGGAYSTFPSAGLWLSDAGAASFWAVNDSNRSAALGIYAQPPGGGAAPVQRVAQDAAPAPCSPPGTYIMTTSVPFTCSRNGKMAWTCRFDATGTGLTYGAVFSGPYNSIGMHVRQDDPPASSGFTSFGGAQMNEHGVACLGAGFFSPGPPPPGGTGGSRTGIYTGATGAMNATATSLSVISDYNGGPGFGDVHWTGFNSFCVNGSNSVAFHANIDSPTSANGLFIFDAQGIRTIALASTALPASTGIAATWGAFNPPIICDNGDAFFMANFSGPGINSSNNVALFRYRNHTTSLVARSGQTLTGLPAGQTLALSLTNIAGNSAGQVVLTAGTQPGFVEVVLATDRLGNIRVVYKAPDQLNVRGTLTRSFSSFTAPVQSGGNDGRQSAINARGEIALSASCNIPSGQPFGPNGRCIVVFQAPYGPCGAADVGGQGGLFGADGLLDNNDFVVFIDLFFSANPVADVGIQGGLRGSDGVFDNNDFVQFIDLFFTPCQ